MQEPDDIALLKQYAEGDELAFTVLFQRHVHLVYSAALRQARNPSHAEEITQAVFILLARKAKSLNPKTVLSGWLYQAARLTAASLIKREIRRQRREQEVYMQTLTEPETRLWEQISPLLEDAMGRLGEQDRNAIVLRFFENKTPQEVAATLKLNEVTARKRVSRALEKLRNFFAKRGVVLTAAIIAGAISGNSVQAAPAAVANSAAAVAIAKGAAASTSTLTLVKGALKLMAWTKAKTTIIAGAAALLAIGGGTVAVNVIAASRTATALSAMQGNWEGTYGPYNALIVLRIFQTNGVYKAAFDAIDQGLEIPVTKLSANSHWIHAEAPAVPLDYQATLNADGTVMTGSGKVNDTPMSLVLKRTDAAETILTLSPEQYARRPDSPLQGEWAGTLNTGEDMTRMILRIAETAPGTFQAVLDLPDNPGSANLHLRSVTFNRPTVRLAIGGNDGDGFQGNINASDDELAGTLTWNKNKFPLKFERVQTNTQATAESEKDYGQGGYFEIQGHWKGTVQMTQAAWAGKTEVPIVYNIAKMPDGSYSATLELPDQGAEGATAIPATSVNWTSPNIRIEWKQLGAGIVFTGKLENGRLSGTIRQNKDVTPIQLERGS